MLVCNKRAGEIVQGDKTGDVPLVESLKLYIKQKYEKPGDVFLGVTHRLDRPVSGVCLFARTSKALARMNAMFADKEQSKITKTYRAIVPIDRTYRIGEQHTLRHWIVRNERLNKSFAHDTERSGSKLAILNFTVLAYGERYMLLQIDLKTGRHHQIRCQLAKIGLPIMGDLKYGAPRPLKDGSIALHAYRLKFEHPVSHASINIVAPPPDIFDIFK